ncbi:MAG: hypothetical protein ABI462_15255 [Ignavibacteria bacterium]
MDYSFIIIGFVGGAVLVLIIASLIFKKEKVSSVKTFESANSLLANDEIQSGVKMLLASGKKIEAIKFVIKHKNLGLADGKKLVEIIEQVGTNDPSVFKNFEAGDVNKTIDPTVLNQVRKLLVDGKKIEAIKLVVRNRNMGLKEAKDFVDTLQTNYKP